MASQTSLKEMELLYFLSCLLQRKSLSGDTVFGEKSVKIQLRLKSTHLLDEWRLAGFSICFQHFLNICKYTVLDLALESAPIFAGTAQNSEAYYVRLVALKARAALCADMFFLK